MAARRRIPTQDEPGRIEQRQEAGRDENIQPSSSFSYSADPDGKPPKDDYGRGEETPREKPTMKKPNVPTPMAGAASTEGPGTGGVMPFQPLPSPSFSSMANPAQRGLYGSLGGLQGGGLGVPLDPTSDAQSDPLSALIAMLTRGR